MRIISRFKDFYDGVMKTGMDRTVVYVREEKKISTTEDFGVTFSTQDSGLIHRMYGGYSIKLLFLGYCGQIMRVMDLKYDIKNLDQRPGALPTVECRKVFYDYKEFETFMIDNQLEHKRNFENSYYPSRFYRYRDLDTNRMQEIFHRFQVPVFLLTRVTGAYSLPGITTINLGPRLKTLDFQKIKDAYTTYQDIFQYVSGVLNQREEMMAKISDKDKIAKHGFDKFSFRKMPKKKK
jgi:hypothetical protein